MDMVERLLPPSPRIADDVGGEDSSEAAGCGHGPKFTIALVQYRALEFT
jgi:hypothetical protein